MVKQFAAKLRQKNIVLTIAALLLEALIFTLFGGQKLTLSGAAELSAWVLIGVNLAALFVNVYLLEYSRRMKLIITLAVLFRVALLVWHECLSGVIPFPAGETDEAGFLYGAEWLYRHGEINHSHFQYDDPYPVFVGGVIYRLFGLQPLMAQYVNLLMSVATILIVVGILRRLDISERTTEKAAALMAIVPFFAMYSVLFLREAVVQFLLALSVYAFVRYWENGKIINAALSVAFSVASGFFHSSGIVVAGMLVLHIVLFDRTAGRYRFSRKGLWMIPLFAAAFVLVWIVAGEQLFFKFGSNLSLEVILDMADRAVWGEAAYDIGISTGINIVDFVVNSPLRMIYFLLSPMPWDWRGVVDAAAFFLSSCVYGYAVVCFVRMLWNVRGEDRRKQVVVVLFVTLLAAVFVFSWGVSNAGTAIRHRDKLISLCFVIMAASRELAGRKGAKIERGSEQT